jgi:hypothetical protein
MLEIRPPKSQLKTQKWRIVSARQNLLLHKGVQAHGHNIHKGVDLRSAFLSLVWWGPAPFTQLDQVRVHNLLMMANSTLGICGGVGSNFSVKTEPSEQEPGTPSS